MLVHILGSAAGGGFPQWNCACPNCHGVRTRSIRAVSRTQESVCLTANGADYLLINASPDIRSQIEQTAILHPRRIRDSPIAAIVLTNGDLDHCLGLLSLREWQPLAVYTTASVRHGLVEQNILFRTLERFSGQITWRELKLEAEEPLMSASGRRLGLSVRAVPAPGKAPLHLEGAVLPSEDQNIGLLVREDSNQAVLAYFPSVRRLTPLVRETIACADLLVFDGTFWSGDELIGYGISRRSAEDMAHIPMSGEQGSLALLADLTVSRRLFTHINNTNPILREDSPERGLVEAAGWDAAHDGMELKL